MNEAKIEDILTRGVEDIFVREELEKKLKSGKTLNVKFGIDPTGPKIHLGRAVPLRKLRAFQDLGHQVVLIVGDFTAQIGDPSDKLEKRPMLDEAKIKENLKGYLDILGQIIDIKKTKVVYNSEWLGKLNFGEISKLAESFSVQQMLARRNFKDRFEKGEEISVREFLYPLMQGYDSVMVGADIEIGGFDQLFNIKAGRVIQRYYGKPEQDVLTCQMLEGTDGRKMSTSWGNVINITDEPNEMYGKIMSLRDELIGKYFLLCTSVAEGDIAEMEEGMKTGKLNPKEAKMKLAREIVTIYHDAEKAEEAEEYFTKAFQKKEIPDDVVEVEAGAGEKLVDVLLRAEMVKSKSDFRRLITEGAISVGGEEKVSDPDESVQEAVYKIGKKKFLKIKPR